MHPILTAAIVATLATAAPLPAHAWTCDEPWSAIAIGHTLERQAVGRKWAPLKVTCSECSASVSVADRAMVITFGCDGDYQDELRTEDQETGPRFVRFTNDAAHVIVVFN